MNKALFLDRDGTINIDKDYVYRIEDFEFIDGIFEVCSYFQSLDYQIFIITNQSGIARGYYTEKEFFKLNDWMLEQFQKKRIYITKVYFCPHHPQFTGECNCRKPKPGMILQALKEYQLDITKSILIGDSPTDIEAGINAGISRLIYLENSKNYLKKELFPNIYITKSLKDILHLNLR